MKHRLLSTALAVVMLMTTLMITPIAAVSAEADGDFQYELLPDGTAQIIDYAGSATDITIPTQIDDYTITSIGNGTFWYCDNITSITIPDSVTSIGSDAFSYCTALTSVNIPAGVTTIGERAFSNCTSLASIIIPHGVTSIELGTFSVCSALTSITIPDSVTEIGDNAFSDCSGLAGIILPDSITYIGSNAFDNTAYYNNADNWEHGALYIGNHLIEVDNTLAGEYTARPGTKTISNAFSGCSALTSVTIPDSVTEIGDNAFSGCSALTSITIPNSVTEIGDSAFFGCSALATITIPNSVTEIRERTFRSCTNLASIIIPEGVTSIEWEAFAYCTNLASITIPDSVSYIASSAFYGTAYSNNADNWEQGVLYIGKHLIEADDSISGEYTIRPGTKAINSSAFANCTFLTSITIPDSVTSIDDYTFSDCSSLAAVTIPDSVKRIGSCAFSGCSALASIDIPEGMTTIDNGAFQNCSDLTSITIPDSVTAIGNWAFYGCTNLASITLPDADIAIGDSTTLSSAGNQTFMGTAYSRNEDNWAEDGMYIGNHLYSPRVSSGNYTVRPGTRTIACLAFYQGVGMDNNLTAITIPGSVTYISSHAFWGCSALTDVYYTGTEADWAAINFNSGNAALLNATVHFISPCPDITASAWYYDAVNYVSAKGFMTGYATGTFGPADNLQRQDFVVTLARVAGADLTAYQNTNGGLSDVQVGSYYTPAVAWAVESGIITGYQNGKFGVGDTITREQVATILYRYLDSPAVADADATLAVFPDKASVSVFAKDALAWAVDNGVISGMQSGEISPTSGASRAQIATILMRMDQSDLL